MGFGRMTVLHHRDPPPAPVWRGGRWVAGRVSGCRRSEPLPMRVSSELKTRVSSELKTKVSSELTTRVSSEVIVTFLCNDAHLW